MAEPRGGASLAAEQAVVSGLGPAHPGDLRGQHLCTSFPKVCRAQSYLQEQGMRDLPTAVYPDKSEGVTLKCPKAQETVSLSMHILYQ